MHKCLDYDLNDKLSRDECAEVYPKMWEYVTKLEVRIACLTARQAELEALIKDARACGPCADFVLDEYKESDDETEN